MVEEKQAHKLEALGKKRVTLDQALTGWCRPSMRLADFLMLRLLLLELTVRTFRRQTWRTRLRCRIAAWRAYRTAT